MRHYLPAFDPKSPNDPELNRKLALAFDAYLRAERDLYRDLVGAEPTINELLDFRNSENCNFGHRK